MSVEIMSAVYRAKFGSPNLKAVALKLADHANNEGRGIYPSKRTVSEQTELSERTVQRAIDQLLAMGVLVKVRASKGGKSKATTVYRFDLAALASLPPVAASRAPKGCHGDTPKSSEGCQAVTPRGVTVTPEPSRTQPSINKYQPSHTTREAKPIELDFNFGGETQQARDDGEWVDGLDDAGEARLVAEASAAAAASKPKPIAPAAGVGARLNRLPILPEVLAKLQLMGLDVAALIKEFERETAAKQISNPTGYLMGMARKRVAQRDGIPVAAVEAMYSTDAKVKGEAMAALVGAKVERRWKGARHRASAGHGPQHVGSHLIAALENRGLGA